MVGLVYKRSNNHRQLDYTSDSRASLAVHLSAGHRQHRLLWLGVPTLLQSPLWWTGKSGCLMLAKIYPWRSKRLLRSLPGFSHPWKKTPAWRWHTAAVPQSPGLPGARDWYDRLMATFCDLLRCGYKQPVFNIVRYFALFHQGESKGGYKHNHRGSTIKDNLSPYR